MNETISSRIETAATVAGARFRNRRRTKRIVPLVAQLIACADLTRCSTLVRRVFAFLPIRRAEEGAILES